MTSTRSMTAAGILRRSTPPFAAVAKESICRSTPPRGPRLCRLALLERGTPSRTMRVPKAERSAELRPTPASSENAPRLDPVGTERSAICSTSPSPGARVETPGTSCSTPARLVAVMCSIASRSMTLAVPSSPSARLTASAVTVMSRSRRALTANAMSRVSDPSGGTVRRTRAVASPIRCARNTWEPRGTPSSRYRPWSSVSAEIVVPSMTTRTPASGADVDSSIIRPLMLTPDGSCARTAVARTLNPTTTHATARASSRSREGL